MTVANQKNRRRSIIMLLACLLLGAVVAVEVVFAPSYEGVIPGGAAGSGPELNAPIGNTFSLKPLESYAEVAERPLFQPTRRPPPEIAEIDDGGKSNKNKITLLGVMVFPDLRMALIKRKNSAENIRVFEGEKVDGWVMESVQPDHIVLRRGSLAEVVKLRDLKIQRRSGAKPSEPKPATARQPQNGTRNQTPNKNKPKLNQPGAASAQGQNKAAGPASGNRKTPTPAAAPAGNAPAVPPKIVSPKNPLRLDQ